MVMSREIKFLFVWLIFSILTFPRRWAQLSAFARLSALRHLSTCVIHHAAMVYAKISMTMSSSYFIFFCLYHRKLRAIRYVGGGWRTRGWYLVLQLRFLCLLLVFYLEDGRCPAQYEIVLRILDFSYSMLLNIAGDDNILHSIWKVSYVSIWYLLRGSAGTVSWETIEFVS